MRHCPDMGRQGCGLVLSRRAFDCKNAGKAKAGCAICTACFLNRSVHICRSHTCFFVWVRLLTDRLFRRMSPFSDHFEKCLCICAASFRTKDTAGSLTLNRIYLYSERLSLFPGTFQHTENFFHSALCPSVFHLSFLRSSDPLRLYHRSAFWAMGINHKILYFTLHRSTSYSVIFR